MCYITSIHLFKCHSFLHLGKEHKFLGLNHRVWDCWKKLEWAASMGFEWDTNSKHTLSWTGYEWKAEHGIFLWDGTENFQDSCKWDSGLKSRVLQWMGIFQNNLRLLIWKSWLDLKNFKKNSKRTEVT